MTDNLAAIRLTLELASVTTVWLLLIGTPVAWWLARGRGTMRSAVEAVVALPLILPPTVLGFYLLIAFAPDTPVGRAWRLLTGDQLAFTFDALVIGSIIYSLPFVVQPLQAAFRQLPMELLEAAATLGAGPFDRWRSVVFPICRGSFVTAASLGFAHTVGEFGVVLMIGGNIPGETQVLSIALYDRVETLQFDQAHAMAAGLMLFSFVTLFLLYRRPSSGWGLAR
jgi:molybdate transport system permease protein